MDGCRLRGSALGVKRNRCSSISDATAKLLKASGCTRRPRSSGLRVPSRTSRDPYQSILPFAASRAAHRTHADEGENAFLEGVSRAGKVSDGAGTRRAMELPGHGESRFCGLNDRPNCLSERTRIALYLGARLHHPARLAQVRCICALLLKSTQPKAPRSSS